ncbi:MAG: hypothetical protein AAF721_36340 [Myxococcota bacterium]
MKKLVVRSLILIALAMTSSFGYLLIRWGSTHPDVPKPAIIAVTNPDVVARGRYLFHAVGHCSGCHAARDEVRALGVGDEAVPSGGEVPMGPLGTLRAPNLTADPQTGVGAHSDGELARAIRYGIKADDTVALLMISAGPYADEDLTALISYMRTLAPVRSVVPPSEVTLLGKVIMQTAASHIGSPRPAFATPPYVPAGVVSAERGKYLAEGPAACFGCHSEFDGSDFVGELFAGNPEPWPDPEVDGASIFAPNLTPHATAGALTGVSEDDFIRRMRAPRMYTASPMPWENFRSMTDGDLRSIYRHLASLPASPRDVGPAYQSGG